jgi:hypothetical protein
VHPVLKRLLVIFPILFLGLGLGVVAMFMGAVSQPEPVGTGRLESVSCRIDVTGTGSVDELDSEQLANVRVIVDVGAARGISAQGRTIALATALQESTLHNLDHGDRDSLGLFQQRPSMGWGTAAQIMDPRYSSGKFYDALLKVPGWPTLPLTVAAQAVQRSAFPLAYAKWEPLAAKLAGIDGGTFCPDYASGLPDDATGAMLRAALAQQGDPYVWGATGPDAFDCSGLIVYAWRQAGFVLNIRTAAQMHDVADPVPAGQEKPGDLIFSQFGTRVAGAGHVKIVVRPGLSLEAPRTGLDVRLKDYDPQEPGIRFGRLPASAMRALPTSA